MKILFWFLKYLFLNVKFIKIKKPYPLNYLTPFMVKSFFSIESDTASIPGKVLPHMMPTGQHLLPEAVCGQNLKRITVAKTEEVKAREIPWVDGATSLPLNSPAENCRQLVGTEH